MSPRAILAGWLGLVVLSTIVTARGSDATAGILGDLGKILDAALDPRKPAFKDRGSGVFKKGPIPNPNSPGVGGASGGHVHPNAPSGTGGNTVPRPI